MRSSMHTHAAFLKKSLLSPLYLERICAGLLLQVTTGLFYLRSVNQYGQDRTDLKFFNVIRHKL